MNQLKMYAQHLCFRDAEVMRIKQQKALDKASTSGGGAS
jgi:hypothetical protein